MGNIEWIGEKIFLQIVVQILIWCRKAKIEEKRRLVLMPVISQKFEPDKLPVLRLTPHDYETNLSITSTQLIW